MDIVTILKIVFFVLFFAGMIAIILLYALPPRKIRKGPIVDTDDEMMAEVITRTFQTGKPHIANRDKNGKVTIRQLDE